MTNQTITSNDTQCYHCGTALQSFDIELDNHQFCCVGCREVYSILSQNQLCDYYLLQDMPGNSFAESRQIEDYSYLDNQALAKEIVDFSDESVVKVRFQLPQIHCNSCIWLLENLNRLHKGILNSRVNFVKKQIAISYQPNAIKLSEVVILLVRFGYVPVINLHSADRHLAKKKNNTLYYKVGIAGFSFGNIMLNSFPEYTGSLGELTSEYSGVFRILNAILILPVVFYSGFDYIQNAWNALKTGILNLDVPIAIGMFTLFLRSYYEIVTATGSGYFDSLAGFIFFLLLGKVFQEKTYSTLSFENDFRSFFPLSASKVVGGREEAIKITSLQTGDIIRVKNNEMIPADAVLLSDQTEIDFSFVTGESVPVVKHKGDFVYAGGRQKNGIADFMISRKVEESYLTDLWKNAGSKAISDKNISNLTEKTGKYFTYAILIVAGFTLFYWMFYDISIAMKAFTSVLIVACPCALSLCIPFTEGSAMRVLARNQFFLKESRLLEILSKINYFIFDKTGTLSVPGKATIEFIGTPLSHSEQRLVASIAYQSGHPLSRRIFDKIGISTATLSTTDSFEEILGRGISGVVEGKKVMLGNAEFVSAPMRISNSTKVYLKIDNEIAGYFAVKHHYRNGLSGMISKIKSKAKVILLSGDHDHEKEQLLAFFKEERQLYFMQNPEDKFNVVKALKEQNHQVAMVGDGLNDAAALKESDFGISVTDDVNNFAPASDAIIKGSELYRLPDFVQFAKKSQHIVYAGFTLSLTYNIVGLSFAIQGKLSPVVSAILMPLSSITVVIFSVLVVWLTARKMKLA